MTDSPVRYIVIPEIGFVLDHALWPFPVRDRTSIRSTVTSQCNATIFMGQCGFSDVTGNPRAYLILIGVNAMRLKRYMYSIVGMVLLALGFCTAQASTVVYEDSAVVLANSATSNPFTVTAGTYEATLVDYEYTSIFDTLSLNITQGDNVLGFGIGTGKFTFNVLTPGGLMAHLVANPKTGEKGLYALQITAIPIPPAVMLFISGLIGIVAVGRRDDGLKSTAAA